MRVIMTVMQPCILCEGDIEEWTLSRDDLTGEERIDKRSADHTCSVLAALIRERSRP